MMPCNSARQTLMPWWQLLRITWKILRTRTMWKRLKQKPTFHKWLTNIRNFRTQYSHYLRITFLWILKVSWPSSVANVVVVLIESQAKQFFPTWSNQVILKALAIPKPYKMNISKYLLMFLLGNNNTSSCSIILLTFWKAG